ncbi:MAG: hybrid sensor histidine kinase/response regulator, partial [bacterium]
MEKDNEKLEAEILRKRAEELLKKRPKKNGPPLSEADNLKLIHELEVHQIELELQNQELQTTKASVQRIARNY